MNQTMRDRILSYIENMAPGDRITVKSIAQELETGTEIAYQSIREAELKGLLSFRTSNLSQQSDKQSASGKREGCDKLEGSNKENLAEQGSAQKASRQVDFLKNTLPQEDAPETLTLRIISQVTESQICCGQEFLDQKPRKFLIAAMDLRAMANYLKEGSLCIVGNRPDAQMLALENKSSLLITGNLYPSPEVLGFAQQIGCLIMVSPYETFLVASLINLSLYAEYEKIVFVDGELIPHQRPEDDLEQRLLIDFKFEKASVLTGMIHPWMVNVEKELKSWVLKYLLEFSQTTFLWDHHNLNTYQPESSYVSEIKPAKLGERIRLTSKLVAKQRNSATIETEVTGGRGTILAKCIGQYTECRI